MTTTLMHALGWCALINFGALLFWFAAYLLAADRIYGMHSKMFKISRETFDTCMYAGMGLFKLALVVFNLMPYLALRIVL